jgi:nicotinate-nucleotide--dimethylbenzimidazole phosphoribosyltransferase
MMTSVSVDAPRRVAHDAGMPAPLDASSMQAARLRQASLTKPALALGRLEQLAIQLAGIQRTAIPQARPAACLLFAAEHPVTRHGVSAYPSEVTAAMVANFVGGGAAASVLSRRQGIPLQVVNVGVAMPALPGVVRGASADMPAGDLRTEDAMPPATFDAAFAAGRAAVANLAEAPRVLLLGEMGIGNTTAASAVVAALLGMNPEDAVGAGTGVDAAGRARKVAVVHDALARLPAGLAPLEVLRCVGGRELAAIAGASLEAAERGIAILVDGFIVSAGVLAAARHEPGITPYLIPAHRSREVGHRRVLEALVGDASLALLDLDLALGEASGALLAFPLLELALATHAEMATFDSAGVPDREEGESTLP